MFNLITTLEQAKKNIEAYPQIIEGSATLVDNLAMNRAWYAIKQDNAWVFGNSKVIGYTDMKPEDYRTKGRDGRQTEVVLQKWFEEVDPNHPDYNELWNGLASFLAQYGKHPSKLARINIEKTHATVDLTIKSDAVSDLIIEVAKNLSTQQVMKIRKQLKAML